MNSQLERKLGEDLRGLVASQPFEPDLIAIERRGRRYLRRRIVLTRAGLGAGLAAAAALTLTVATHSPGPRPGTTEPGTVGAQTTEAGSSGRPQAAGQPRESAPAGHPRTSSSAGPQVTLTRLSSYILAAGRPSGDATLVIRKQSYPTGPAISVADLYTDSGEYFFAHSVSGLPEQIASHHNQGGGLFAREIAAAVSADHGDLAAAREKMAEAPDPGHAPASPDLADNYIWENSLDALIAGSGQPQVRAGVLRILSTLPEVTVTSTTTSGQPTLTLRASAPAAPTADYQETLVIGANSGIPVRFTGEVPGQAPGVTITYQVTRVTLSDIAAGRS
jgi:hypothetical protein